MTNTIDNRRIVTGYLFAIGATALWSGNFIIARGLNESIPPISLAFWRWVVAVVVFLPFFIWEYSSGPLVVYEAKTICSILYVGIFASLTVFVLWNKAIEMVGPSKAGMIYYTLPLFSGFLAYLFLQEEIGIIHFFCALLIITGILTANYESERCRA